MDFEVGGRPLVDLRSTYGSQIPYAQMNGVEWFGDFVAKTVKGDQIFASANVFFDVFLR